MQYRKCIKCIKRRLILAISTLSFYVLSTSFLRLFSVMGIWRCGKCIKCIFFPQHFSGQDVIRDLTMRDDKEFYSAHRASFSLRHSVRNAHLPYASRLHNSAGLFSLWQTARGRGACVPVMAAIPCGGSCGINLGITP